MLFQRFDRLLFLARGGRTVYYGEVGENAHILTKYFERYGGHPCPPDANPAEWMLEVIGAAPGSHTDVDWHKAWRESPEFQEVHAELDRIKAIRPEEIPSTVTVGDKASFREFAAPFAVQLWEVTTRVFAQYWRTPSYIYSKASLCVGSVRSYSPFAAFRTNISSLCSSDFHSTTPAPVSKSFRIKCSQFSCYSLYSVNWSSKSCPILLLSDHFMRLVSVHRRLTHGSHS